MHRLFVLLLAGFSVQAQTTINLRGVVSGVGGQPVSGAIVTLVGQNLKDTTGVDGAYSITKGVIAISSHPARTA